MISFNCFIARVDIKRKNIINQASYDRLDCVSAFTRSFQEFRRLDVGNLLKFQHLYGIIISENVTSLKVTTFINFVIAHGEK